MKTTIGRATAGSVIRDSAGRAYTVGEDGSLRRLASDVADEMEWKGAERRRFLIVRDPPSSKYDRAERK